MIMAMQQPSASILDALGHGPADRRLAVLREIGAGGSISQAARAVGVSYKAAWQALDTLTNLAGVPLVERVVGGAGGGGARLTEAAHELLAAAAPPEMSPETPASEPAAEPAAESASAAEAASDAASAPAEAIPTAAPAAPPASDAAPQVTQADTGNAPQASAGVEITPPGAAGAPSGGEAPPVRVPASVRLDFEVTGQAKRFNYSASAELSWRQDGARYEARQQVKAFLLGARSQTSTGRITARGLQPERFGDKARSERAAHFDFEQHQATFSANAPPAPIGDGAQDRLSVFIQLGSLLAAAPQRYPPGTRIALTTVGTKSADRWTFTVEGPETLQLPAGPTPALKLQRVPPPGKEYDQKAELWLGTELGYLPVRIRITQANGDFADLALSGHEAQ